MIDVEWRWRSNSAADAAWQFRSGYGAHWGRMHDLRGYVHALQFEGSSRGEPIVE
jgi:hypothetical protein